jgi:HJR/Mrr/RecB family endonuclease
VGNSAVQEAIAGMVYHGCNGCAVVTNSDFTTSAHALAERSGCRLINGERLRQIIRGEDQF